MRSFRSVALAVALALATSAAAQSPITPAFTYQGQLKQNGALVNAPTTLRFSLWDAPGSGSPPVGGNQIGSTVQLANVPVSNGLFTVLLNDAGQFGAGALNGQSRWLQIEVCADPSCATHTTLAPRQPLTSAPYATFAGPWVQPTAIGTDISYSAGNVGVGTATPSAGLQIKHEPITAAGTLALEGNTHTYMTFFPDGFSAGRKGFFGFPGPTINNIELANEIPGGGLAFVPGYNGNVEIDGKVGINLAAPTATLHVNGNIGVGVANIPAGLTSELGGTSTPLLDLDLNFRQPNHNSAFVGGALRIDSRNDAADPLFQFVARPAGSGAEAVVASLTKTGRLTIGPPPVEDPPNLQIDGVGRDTVYFGVAGHARSGYLEYGDQFVLRNDVFGTHGVTGHAQLNDDGSWSSVSDGRMKEEIAPATGLLDKALALRPAEFRMKGQDLARDPHKYLGLIAQEVRPLLPSLVRAGRDGVLTLNYERVGVVAIGAIQEQQRIIEEQKKKLSEQDARIGQLEATVRSLVADRAGRNDRSAAK